MRKLKLAELNRINVEAFKASEKLPLVILLDNIRSQHNVGSVFRTADAFRVEEVCLCGITATPPHREIQKTALGSTESVQWKYAEDSTMAITEYKSKNYEIIAIEQTTKSQSIQTLQLKKNQKYVIVLGNEVKGVSEEALRLADLAIEIPQHGTKHSLNISVCNGIVVWEFYKQLGAFS